MVVAPHRQRVQGRGRKVVLIAPGVVGAHEVGLAEVVNDEGIAAEEILVGSHSVGIGLRSGVVVEFANDGFVLGEVLKQPQYILGTMEARCAVLVGETPR